VNLKTIRFAGEIVQVIGQVGILVFSQPVVVQDLFEQFDDCDFGVGTDKPDCSTGQSCFLTEYISGRTGRTAPMIYQWAFGPSGWLPGKEAKKGATGSKNHPF